MSVLGDILERLRSGCTSFETYGRHGDVIRKLSSDQFVSAVARYRCAFRGWSTTSYQNHKVVALLFRPEETIEFLVATFAAIAESFTVVPFYPNWDSETQFLHLKQYGIRSLVVGDGFRRRAEGWRGQLERVIKISASLDDYRSRGSGNSALEAFPADIPENHPCAWIFTSGTSGEIPKCTVISLRNIAAAVENIRRVDFIFEGMTIHSPLSMSHIFAFAVVLGIMAVKPGRMLFSDVQYLARLPQEKIGKVDGVILVPLVLNRMRSAFYEKLVAEGPGADPTLARLPMGVRRFLKRCVQRAEKSVVTMECGGSPGLLGRLALAVTRRLFARKLPRRLGSPTFVVVGGAKPNVESMAFLDVMGMRCLQGWGMTETTGALAVCNLNDRFGGAYGTCGDVFRDARAYVEDGELVVEGPQVAEGYIHPDGSYDPFNGVKRTGDSAEFDARGRLKVLGKVADRITLSNGINYNPIPLEERIMAVDLDGRNILDEAVVVGDGQQRLGCVFFVRPPAKADVGAKGKGNGEVAIGPDDEAYLAGILRRVNSSRAVDEQIGPWTFEPMTVRDSGFIGPSGKLRRRLVEERYHALFERARGKQLERVSP